MSENILFLNVDHHLNLGNSTSSGKSVLGGNVIRYFLQNKCSQKMKSRGSMQANVVIKLEAIALRVHSPRKSAKLDNSSTPSWQIKIKQEAAEIKPTEKTTMNNTTTKTAGIVEAVEIPVFEEAQI